MTACLVKSYNIILIVCKQDCQGIYLAWRHSITQVKTFCVGKTCVVLLPYSRNVAEIFYVLSAMFLSFFSPCSLQLWLSSSTYYLYNSQVTVWGKVGPTFKPLCTILWMSKKGSLISSRLWLSILTIPSLSRTKSRWEPSPQCTTATGCLRPLNTSWAQ